MDIEVISPFPTESLPRVWAWNERFRHQVSDDFSPQTQGEFVDAMLAAMDLQKTWAVYGDGELGGMITYQRLSPWVGTAHIFVKPKFQGKGLAPPALKIAFAEMFADGIGKLSFYPLAGNRAVGSLLINLGAKREGCLRSQTIAGGKPIDMHIYGMLKEEFEYAMGAASSRRDRRSELDSGGGPGGPGKDPDQHDHPNLESGDEGTPAATGGLQLEPDEGSVGGITADADRQSGSDQPGV